MTGQMQDSATATACYDSADRQSLDRLCEMAAEVLAAPVAAVVLRMGNISRVIGSSGLEPRYRSRAWSMDEPPFAPDAEMVLTDATQHAAIHAKLALLGMGAIGFFARMPVSVTAHHSLTLVITNTVPGKKPTARQVRLLADIKTLIIDGPGVGD